MRHASERALFAVYQLPFEHEACGRVCSKQGEKHGPMRCLQKFAPRSSCVSESDCSSERDERKGGHGEGGGRENGVCLCVLLINSNGILLPFLSS